MNGVAVAQQEVGDRQQFLVAYSGRSLPSAVAKPMLDGGSRTTADLADLPIAKRPTGYEVARGEQR